jgi:hypothetical protein
VVVEKEISEVLVDMLCKFDGHCGGDGGGVVTVVARASVHIGPRLAAYGSIRVTTVMLHET